MSSLISIDPGEKYYAWAFWEDGLILDSTGLFQFSELDRFAFPPCLAVIERPRIMLKRRIKASSIEGVLIGYGRLLERYPNHIDMAPHTVPEKIWHARILDLLSPAELTIVMQQPAKVRKHTIDAVGLGLKHLGRMHG